MEVEFAHLWIEAVISGEYLMLLTVVVGGATCETEKLRLNATQDAVKGRQISSCYLLL